MWNIEKYSRANQNSTSNKLLTSYCRPERCRDGVQVGVGRDLMEHGGGLLDVGGGQVVEIRICRDLSL